jgi:hypothetical protein
LIRACLVTACAVALVFSGCRRSDETGTIVVRCQVTPQPPQVGFASITADLSDGARPVTGAVVKLEGDMSHPGMEPVFGSAKETAPGRYEGHLQLTMPGDWVILEHITLADGRKLERQLDVNGVRPN